MVNFQIKVLDPTPLAVGRNGDLGAPTSMSADARVPQKFPGPRVALLSKGADLNTTAIASRDRYNPITTYLGT